MSKMTHQNIDTEARKLLSDIITALSTVSGDLLLWKPPTFLCVQIKPGGHIQPNTAVDKVTVGGDCSTQVRNTSSFWSYGAHLLKPLTLLTLVSLYETQCFYKRGSRDEVVTLLPQTVRTEVGFNKIIALTCWIVFCFVCWLWQTAGAVESNKPTNSWISEWKWDDRYKLCWCY
jgi:hypothetical protein